MRILHVNSFYQNNAFFGNLFDAQCRLGEELSVYVPVSRSFRAGDRAFGAYARVEACFDDWDRPFFHHRYNQALARAKALYDVSAYDVLHAHSLFSNGYVAWKLAKEYAKPYIVAVRDCDVNHFLKYLVHLRPMAKAILRDAEKIVFLSEPYRMNALKPYLSDAEYSRALAKSVVVKNGVDDMWLRDMGQARPANMGEIELLFIGRIYARKNPLVAAEATRLLNERGRKAHLTVIGRHEDKALIEKLQTYPCVTVLPPMPMAELLPYYRAADAFVLPSLRETFGIVYAEAMTQALPVVYTLGQGFDGQYPQGTVGYAVDPRDPEKIADRILDIAENRLAISVHCVENAVSYDWNAIAQTYRTLYSEARA